MTRWTELVGVVESVSNGEVTMTSTRKYRVKLSDELLAKYGHLLHPGRSVAILTLEDGSVRIRGSDSQKIEEEL